MERVKLQDGLDSTPAPAEYFDLIGGTSTGGYVHQPRRVVRRIWHKLTYSIQAHCYPSWPTWPSRLESN
jgi:hypothetical protein